MNLQQLHKEIDNCFNCKLSKLDCNILNSNNLTYGKLLTNHKVQNSGKPKLLLIGIAPSHRRFDKSRLAFEGVSPSDNLKDIQTSGDFFYYVLNKSKLKEFDIYITNLIKCSTESNSEPEEESILACKRLLDLEVSIIKPHYIITLGNFVKNHLSKVKLDIEVINIKHPSFYFRFKSQQAVEEELREFDSVAIRINSKTLVLNKWLE